MVYLDTSVLLAYTLTQAVEPQRHRATEKLVNRLRDGSVQAATSFYALHEVYLFALDTGPDFPTGSAYGKAALEHILALPVRILPSVSRVERAMYGRKFRALRDASDLPHAIVAAVYDCDAIVTYDTHFRTIAHLIPCTTPEEFLTA